MSSVEPPYKLSERLGALRIPLTQGARDALEASITEHGVVAPLVVARIAGDNVLLDGHTRAEICQDLGIVPPITEREVENEEQLEVLFVQLQLARRNLPEIGEAFLRGTLYLERKQQGRRPTSRHDGEKSVAQVLADQFGTSPRTIERDAQLVRAMKTIASALGEKARNALCSGEIKATRAEIERLSKMRDDDMNSGLERLRLGEPLDSGSHSAPRTPAPVNTETGPLLRSSNLRLLPPPAAEISHHDAVGDDASPSEGDQDDQDDDQDQYDGPLASADLTPVTPCNEPNVGEEHPVSIFDDLPELTAACEALGIARGNLERLHDGWTFEPGRDVDGVLERLERALELVSEAQAIVDLELIPREHCRGCAGEDCDSCGGFGWFSKSDLQPNVE